jgi:hypothetical protein
MLGTTSQFLLRFSGILGIHFLSKETENFLFRKVKKIWQCFGYFQGPEHHSVALMLKTGEQPKAWAIHIGQPCYFSLNNLKNTSLDIRMRFWAVCVPLLQN